MPLILLVPAIGMLVGTVLGLWIGPGRAVRCGAQHLAAGVIIGSVAVELVPAMREGNRVSAMLFGLAIGAGLMLLLRVLRAKSSNTSGLTMGFVLAMSIDMLIDGLLVALGVANGTEGGLILGTGIAIETLFLGLAIAAMAKGKHIGSVLMVSVLLAVLVTAGGLGGWLTADQLKGWWLTALLSFGTAALLWLVIEELLVEAHEGEGESLLGTAAFFVGFGVTLVL
jgi:ZIP family zinc transporter